MTKQNMLLTVNNTVEFYIFFFLCVNSSSIAAVYVYNVKKINFVQKMIEPSG